MNDAEWNVTWAAFQATMAAYRTRADAGDSHAANVLAEFELCRFCGYHSISALAVAENFCREDAA